MSKMRLCVNKKLPVQLAALFFGCLLFMEPVIEKNKINKYQFNTRKNQGGYEVIIRN